MLTMKQLYDIEQLQKEVEAFDNIKLKLNWEMLRDRDSDQLDFLHYENNELVAFIGLYPFGSTVEVTGMTKPVERRKRYFTQLFEKAMDSSRKIGFKKVLLNAPSTAKEAKSFLKKQNADYSFTEHQMKWRPRSLTVSYSDFKLRPTERKDADLRIQLDMLAFDLSKEDALANESNIINDPDTDLLMIEVNHKAIGKIQIYLEDSQAWIYGFSILPEFQGQGIGSNVLRYLVQEQSKKGYSIHLEVETTNTRALELYKAIGFSVTHAQDYYIYKRE